MKRKFFYKEEIKLSLSGHKLVDYIENNSKNFINQSINEVANDTYISSSNISKIAKKLGFGSFKQLQIWVAGELNNYKDEEYVSKAKSFKDIVNNIKLHYLTSINRTIFNININSFKKLKKIIDNSSNTYTFGIGSSSIAAKEMSDALNIIGKSSSKLNNIHAIFQNINQFNKNENCLIIYSKSLSSKEIKKTREILYKHNVPVFIFTSNQSTNEYSNETLIRFRTMEQENRIMAMTSKISQLLLTDIFINWYGKALKNKIYNDFSKEWRE